MSIASRLDRHKALLAWGAALLVGAALIRPISSRVEWVAALGRSEAVHVVAHLFRYGTMTAFARAAGLAPVRAAVVTLAFAVGQELAQLVSVPTVRGPGAPEAFDLAVDAIAVAAVLALTRRGGVDSAPREERAPESAP